MVFNKVEYSQKYISSGAVTYLVMLILLVKAFDGCRGKSFLFDLFHTTLCFEMLYVLKS
jgi:hypothetical protein